MYGRIKWVKCEVWNIVCYNNMNLVFFCYWDGAQWNSFELIKLLYKFYVSPVTRIHRSSKMDYFLSIFVIPILYIIIVWPSFSYILSFVWLKSSVQFVFIMLTFSSWYAFLYFYCNIPREICRYLYSVGHDKRILWL